ncbi:MAG: hypothetical protein K0R29_437 [Pseudobdellovibrio sp.]|jgi:hypothetical protein|nr:hypothetical protein [Pseudobdellovibrio sp.]
MIKTRNFLVLLIGLFLSSCTTPGVVIDNSNYSIKQHRVAITAALGLVREISQNGRTVVSVFHDKSFAELELTPKTKERYYTKATILGAIRPYRVSVEVLKEVRDPELKAWVVVDSDMRMAAQRASVIEKLLNQSRDEGGTFDQEAPF